MKDRFCTTCLASAGSQTAMTDAPVPEPGSLCICMYCQSLSVYDNFLLLRKPTKDELLELQSDREAWQSIQRAISFARLSYEMKSVKQN